jgi:hypothetical protein
MTEILIERRKQPEPKDESWHLDKKVPVSIIVTILVQAGMVIWAIADIKKDVEVLKADVTALRVRDVQIAGDTRDAIKQLQDQFSRMDAKLDRLIERTSK